ARGSSRRVLRGEAQEDGPEHREQPGSGRVGTSKLILGAKRPEAGLLDQVLGIRRRHPEPPRDPIEVRDVGEDLDLELPNPVSRGGIYLHRGTPSPDRETAGTLDIPGIRPGGRPAPTDSESLAAARGRRPGEPRGSSRENRRVGIEVPERAR